MAELSTVARPYAEALFAAAKGEGSLDAWLARLERLAAVAAHPQVAAVVADPKLGDDQVHELITSLLGEKLPPAGDNFLRLVIENNRLAALGEIARQFRLLKNEAEGVADCLIESAFALSDAQVQDLLAALTRKFGLKLKPEVRVNPELIGGVRVQVGDHVLDTSVKTRLEQMHAALTAA